MLQIKNQLALFFFNPKPMGNHGFSLLELAIVLLVVGIFTSMTLPLLRVKMLQAKIVKTRDHQTYVIHALSAFVARNRRFPCPADPKALGEAAGIEPKERRCPAQKAEGIVPFRTLGIPEAYARDGYGRWMTYAVDSNLADREHENKLSTAPGGRLVVKNSQGFSVIAPQALRPDFIAFVLISHGESGIGAFKGKGQEGKISGHISSPHKKENLDGNFLFVDQGGSDDILIWQTRDNFLRARSNFQLE